MFFKVAVLAIACAICYGIFRIVIWHVRRRRLYELASKLEGPTPLPFIGDAHLLLGSNEDLLEKISEVIRSYRSPSRFWLGPRLLVSVSDPEHIKAMFLSSTILARDVAMVDFLKSLAGGGLITAPVPRWKIHRKLIQPTFNSKILNSFVQIFAAQSKLLTYQMEYNINGPEIEIFNSVFICTLDMICETAMGVNVGAQSNKNHAYADALQKYLVVTCKRLFTPWLHPDFIFNRSELCKEQQKCIKLLHNFTDNVVKMKKVAALQRDGQPEKTGNEDDACESIPRREVFLDHLMKLGCSGDSPTLSDEALREEVDSMVAAGSETTANTSSFVMLTLASHPDVQEKVYRELYEIYGDDDIEKRPVSAEDLPHMKYLERVIKETMRLFPAVPVIIREVAEDLHIGDRIVPRGCSIIVGIHSLHRNEKYWPDPFNFDPDRFLPEEVAKRHPYAFLPFSGGQRNCIGINYAMMSMKTLIATILRRYTLKKDHIVPVKDIRLAMQFVLRPVDPIKIRIERRTRK